ncbi:hypothetical protein [Streptomyces sp. NPDC059786]|uniref:hypothetical protein n=1 Tax=Streptomyces sp. NPDC059786 TaxID=3346946 RepID=UPI0036652E6C
MLPEGPEHQALIRPRGPRRRGPGDRVGTGAGVAAVGYAMGGAMGAAAVGVFPLVRRKRREDARVRDAVDRALRERTASQKS